MRILHVSTADVHGGAEVVAWNLFDAARRHGHEARLAVGRKRTTDPDVVLIPNEARRGAWTRVCHAAGNRLDRLSRRHRGLGLWRLASAASWLATPGRHWDRWRGHEDFRWPGTWDLLDLPGSPPDVIHGHNLHGSYFDLRALPWLSRRRPVILTLQDAWLLSGHCAHSLACERWRTGCGRCPDLTLYPPLTHDGTSANFRRKRAIYRNSRLHVATPCRWLMDKVEASMLMEGAAETRVIPNAVDLDTFSPRPQQEARARLGIPPDDHVLLFIAQQGRRNRWKDYKTVHDAAALLGAQPAARRIRLLVFGEAAEPEPLGTGTIQFVPFQPQASDVAWYYRAADVYVHAAHADTFPNTVLEALACGTPVIGTAVGGIPEQIRGLAGTPILPEYNRHGIESATGLLTQARDAQGLASAIAFLLGNPPLRGSLKDNAVRDARDRFSFALHLQRYLAWYAELAAGPAPGSASAGGGRHA